jgi:hypothetical protein
VIQGRKQVEYVGSWLGTWTVRTMKKTVEEILFEVNRNCEIIKVENQDSRLSEGCSTVVNVSIECLILHIYPGSQLCSFTIPLPHNKFYSISLSKVHVCHIPCNRHV